VLLRQVRIPSRTIEGVVRVVVDTVTRRAVLKDHLPRRPLRWGHLWTRGATDLRGDRRRDATHQRTDTETEDNPDKQAHHATPFRAAATGPCSSQSCPSQFRTDATR